VAKSTQTAVKLGLLLTQADGAMLGTTCQTLCQAAAHSLGSFLGKREQSAPASVLSRQSACLVSQDRI
jgi:hypothetical protein